MLIQTIIEAIVVIALIVGMFNEEKIADFEQRLFKRIANIFKKA